MSQSLILLLSASALTSALLMPNMDRIISATLKAGKFHKPGVLTTVMQGGNIWGYGVIFISLLLFLFMPDKHVGWTALKATVCGCVLARGFTIISGRQRPYASPHDSLNFNWFKGLQYSHAAFPSGHATVAFAFAAAVDKTTPPSLLKTGGLYSLACITALSRVYHAKHWLSDVLIGRTLGYSIGSHI